MKRMPVVYKNTPLMPMKATRVNKFIANGTARIKYDRKLKLYYLELLVTPSGNCTQEIRLGIDPGSCFDGFSIVSKTNHHENYELIQRPKKGKNSIKSFKTRQAQNRRIRRSRLWHRPIRFDARNKTKLSPTIRANNDFRKWLILKLLRYYPISCVELEDVRFNHVEHKYGKYFSLVEQGKADMMHFIENVCGLQLVLCSGYETAALRKSLFGGVDLKNKKKDVKTFYSHCVDSYVLACAKEFVAGDAWDDVAPRIIVSAPKINKRVVFIEKVVKIRRCLTRLRKKYKDSCKYYRLKPGNQKEYYVNMSSKSNKCRVKLAQDHSNRPRNWEYLDHGKSERFKCNTAPYGGTIINGKSFFLNNGWYNRKLEVHNG